MKNLVLPPETEHGNIEYKLHILDLEGAKFIRLSKQMKWRTLEGDNVAIYYTGVHDSVYIEGIVQEEMTKSLVALRKIASEIVAEASLEFEESVAENKTFAKVIVRTGPKADQNCPETRIALLGNKDAGKSTLIRVLTRGMLDNGHGSSSKNILQKESRYKCQSYKKPTRPNTSRINNVILGCDQKGNTFDYSKPFMTLEDYCMQSTKIVNFIDLAGHEEFSLTTIRGVNCQDPNYAMLVVDGAAGPVHTRRCPKFHQSLAMAVQIPIIVVITKIDLITIPTLEYVIRSVEKLLESVGELRSLLRVIEDIATCWDGSEYPNSMSLKRDWRWIGYSEEILKFAATFNSWIAFSS